MQDNIKHKEPYTDLHEVLKYFHIARAKAERLIREGMPMLRIGKHRRFKISEIEEWLRNRNKE